ncbi:MAG: ribosome biogenesis factor YjgA [Gammaproteobacteria bacterium]
MARKSRKGYYVEGEFIPQGSDADQQFRNEMKGTDEQSRTELKEASEKLQELGEELLTLRADLFAGLPLPEKLRDAILEAKRITNFEGKRRQKQFIGKLMHRLDADALEAVAAALRVQRSQSAQDTLRLHQAEKWRDALIAGDAELGSWLQEFPATDVQQLRALIRQARKDARDAKPGESLRQGRAYRQIFVLVREQLSSSAGTPS